MSHLDDGHNGRCDTYITIKQFWIIVLLGLFLIVWSLIYWAQQISNTINTGRK